jgi:hypothetical protein
MRSVSGLSRECARWATLVCYFRRLSGSCGSYRCRRSGKNGASSLRRATVIRSRKSRASAIRSSMWRSVSANGVIAHSDTKPGDAGDGPFAFTARLLRCMWGLVSCISALLLSNNAGSHYAERRRWLSDKRRRNLGPRVQRTRRRYSVNGSFESGPANGGFADVDVLTGSAVIPGWDVFGVSIDYLGPPRDMSRRGFTGLI